MSFLALVPWYIRVAAVALILIAAVAFGFSKGLDYKQAQWDEVNRKLAAERAEEVERLQANARHAQEQVSAEREQRANDARKFRERLRHATHLTTCRSPVVFTPEFVGLWNEGLYQGLPGPTNPARVNGTGAGTDSADAADALANHAANSEICNKLRSQLAGWQQLARKNGWVNR